MQDATPSLSGLVAPTDDGSYVPVLWGGSLFSLASVFFGTVAGIVGIILGYRLSKYLGFI